MRKRQRTCARLLALVLVGLSPLAVVEQQQVSPQPRTPYVIQSDDATLRQMLPVRHRFRGRFTAALTAAEVSSLAGMGIATARVVRYQPARPAEKCSPWPACKGRDTGNGGGGATDTRVALPSDRTAWGIELLYRDGGVSATSGGALVRVAVLDTGVQANHPDLARRVVECVDFASDARSGRTRVRAKSCPDPVGHGTLVAGIIAADGGEDGLGLFGVAPEVDLLAYNVCEVEGCWADDVAAAIDYAAKHDAHIVSMSLSGSEPSPLVLEAIAENPGILFIAAAGNDGPGLGSIDYPGAHVAVVAVAAIDELLQAPDWSSRGANDGDALIEAHEVDVAAPGVRVESTWPDGGYRVVDGTSFAASHVAGLAAKLWTGDAATTRALLHSLASDVGAVGDDPDTGLGVPAVSPEPPVEPPPIDPPPGDTLRFASDWGTGEVTDGGKWSHDPPRDNISIIDDGPGGRFGVRLRNVPSAPSNLITSDFFDRNLETVPYSLRFYARPWMQQSSNLHVLQDSPPSNCFYWGLMSNRRPYVSMQGKLQQSLPDNWDGPDGGDAKSISDIGLERGSWYRVEMQIVPAGGDGHQIRMQVYDSSGGLVLDESSITYVWDQPERNLQAHYTEAHRYAMMYDDTSFALSTVDPYQGTEEDIVDIALLELHENTDEPVGPAEGAF